MIITDNACLLFQGPVTRTPIRESSMMRVEKRMYDLQRMERPRKNANGIFFWKDLLQSDDLVVTFTLRRKVRESKISDNNVTH
jgi:hypothetical protein